MILPHDRQIAEWLSEGPEQGPPQSLVRALAATRRTRKRPRWTFPERWLPMQLTVQRPMVPRTVLYLASLALLLAALVVAVLVAGTPKPTPLGVTNGAIAYDAGGKIYLADADGSNPRLLGQVGGTAYSPVFSPDGSQIAYLSTNDVGLLHVFVANADGTGAHQVSQVAPENTRNKFPPVWSPDGSKLVHNARDGGIWVVAADGSSQERIAEGWSVAWSPDGQWIAFRSDGSPDALLRVIHPDGTDLRTLTTGPADSDAFATIRWTPDSSRIVFHRDGIWTVDLDENVEQLSPEGGYPTVSPDGRWVAFFHEVAPGTEELRLVELATGGITTLSSTGGCLAVWSPDSTAIVTYANGCFQDLQRIPLNDPDAAVTFGLPDNVEGFPAWQAIPASAGPADEG
jgi:Tol biopolymer transport system component